MKNLILTFSFILFSVIAIQAQSVVVKNYSCVRMQAEWITGDLDCNTGVINNCVIPPGGKGVQLIGRPGTCPAPGSVRIKNLATPAAGEYPINFGIWTLAGGPTSTHPTYFNCMTNGTHVQTFLLPNGKTIEVTCNLDCQDLEVLVKKL